MEVRDEERRRMEESNGGWTSQAEVPGADPEPLLEQLADSDGVVRGVRVA